MELDDGTLVKHCQNGDRKAFQTLVCRYQKKLFSVAYGMVHHPDDALDVVQEAFLKVHRYLPRFQGNSSFYTWLYRIVINLCIDFLRREGRHQALDYDDAIQHSPDDHLDSEPFVCSTPVLKDPLQALKNKELGQQIWKAIDGLSTNHRSVITLREIEGMSYEEIAQTLKCSKGTVMSRLHHARARLRLALRAYTEIQDRSEATETKRENIAIPSEPISRHAVNTPTLAPIAVSEGELLS